MGRISAWVAIAVCAVGLGFSGCGSDDAPGTQADGGLTDAGSVDAGVDGGVTPPATLTVQGSLVDEHGKPVSGWVALNRDLEHAKTVGADGLFSFTGVEAPYDLEASDGQAVLELTRLHRADPRVPLQLQVSHSAVVSGQLVSDSYLWTVAGVHQAGLDSDRVTDPSNDLGILGLLLVSDDVSTVSSGNETFTTAP